MINKLTFGSFIREKRLEKGITQKELAEQLFVSESAVSKWEMGKSYPDITLIPDICKALDVSEHELIEGANDTQYRQMKKEAKLYRKISETFFWGFTGSYIAAFVISLICDIAANRALTFSPTVFGGLLTAFAFIPTCIRFTENHKLAVFAGSTYLSLIVLFMICCIQYKQNWFFAASAGVLLGYDVIFGPFIIKRYIPGPIKRYRTAFYFLSVFIFSALLIISVKTVSSFSFVRALLVLLYCYIPFAVILLMSIAKTNNFIRAAADVLSFGITCFSANRVVEKLFGTASTENYDVDFSDWVNHTNGNIFFIILAVSILLAVIFAVTGIVKKKKA